MRVGRMSVDTAAGSPSKGRLGRVFGFALAAGVIAAAGAGMSSIACSTNNQILPVKEPDKCTLQVVGMSIISSPRINPTENGCPRPVQLRIYQLKTDARMLNAT